MPDDLYARALKRLDDLVSVEKAAKEGPWYAEEITQDGLTVVDDGRTADDSLFPFECETFEARFCVAFRNSAPELLVLLRALLVNLQGQCRKCGGKGEVRVRHGTSFETDSPAERLDCWHKAMCECRQTLDAALREFAGGDHD